MLGDDFTLLLGYQSSDVDQNLRVEIPSRRQNVCAGSWGCGLACQTCSEYHLPKLPQMDFSGRPDCTCGQIRASGWQEDETVPVYYDSPQLSSREKIRMLERFGCGQGGHVEERSNPPQRCKAGRHCILLLESHLAIDYNKLDIPCSRLLNAKPCPVHGPSCAFYVPWYG